MTRVPTSLPAAYFDAKYAADADPWRFATSAYEREKYAATLDALPRPRYASALEIGCSIGVLTRALAARCEALVAVDAADAALAQAVARCRDLAHVAFARLVVPAAWPAGRFDLILLSEVIYYLDRADVARLARRVAAAALPGADIILVHWLGETDYPLTGDEAADAFCAALAEFAAVGRLRQARTPDYRLDVLRVTNAAIAGRTSSPA